MWLHITVSREMLAGILIVILTCCSESFHWNRRQVSLGTTWEDYVYVCTCFPSDDVPIIYSICTQAALASGSTGTLQRVRHNWSREQGSGDNQICFWFLELSSTREWRMEFPLSTRESTGQKKKKRESKKTKDNGKHCFEKVNQGNQDGKW